MDAIIDKLEARIDTQEKDEGLPPGLLEQLRHQLSVLKNDKLPDLQLIGVPVFSPTTSNIQNALPPMLFSVKNLRIANLKPETGKRYVSFRPVINHPFSRGTIVRI